MVGREEGKVILAVMPDVKRESLEPVLTEAIVEGSTIYTDSAKCYNFLEEVGYHHESVNHSQREYVRGEVHENRAEAIWSLLRPWLAIFRGVSQDNLPSYVKVFQFLFNHRHLNAFDRSQLVLKHILEENSLLSDLSRSIEAKVISTAHAILI